MANEEHGHVALPKLYGAPAYARPPAKPVTQAERPFDPDALPLESAQTEEERRIAQQLVGRPYEGAAGSEPLPANGNGTSHPKGRPFRLNTITDRILGGGHDSGD